MNASVAGMKRPHSLAGTKRPHPESTNFHLGQRAPRIYNCPIEGREKKVEELLFDKPENDAQASWTQDTLILDSETGEVQFVHLRDLRGLPPSTQRRHDHASLCERGIAHRD